MTSPIRSGKPPTRWRSGRHPIGLGWVAAIPLTLAICVPAASASTSHSNSAPPNAATAAPDARFCSNNSDLCTPPTPQTTNGYAVFCANNSDLCTVTALGGRPHAHGAYTCTLTGGPNHCPAGAEIIGGPRYH
jgi:hypothetical protein